MVKRQFSHVASFKISLTSENTLHLLNCESGMPVHKARSHGIFTGDTDSSKIGYSQIRLYVQASQNCCLGVVLLT